MNLPKEISPVVEELIKFLGYDLIKLGWLDSDPGDPDGETEWQSKNQEWIERNNIRSVGWFFIDVNKDYWIEAEHLNIFRHGSLPNRRYISNWNVMMEVIAKAEKDFSLRIPIYPDKILKTAETCLSLIEDYLTA